LKKTLSIVIGAFLLNASLLLASSTDGVKVISSKKAEFLKRNGNALFIDARNEKLFLKGTIYGSINIPLKEYDKLKALLPSKDTTLVVFCNGVKCHLSGELAAMLVKDGYTDVLNYSGGFPEWKEKGLTVTGLVKECKDKPEGPYVPKREKVTINGVTVYPGQDASMIDQFWLADMIKKDTVPKGIQFVDVRKPEDYKQGHLKGAINIPFDTKTSTLDTSKLPKENLVVFYCNTGMMSTDAYISIKDKELKKNILYFDANIDCSKGKCSAEANEEL
jgi:rhodanese-related sulfurtransferase